MNSALNKINNCLQTAQSDYTANWNSACQAVGQKSGCATLSTLNAEYVNQAEQTEISACQAEAMVLR